MNNLNAGGVYVLQSPSGKCYVGQTKHFRNRFWQHKNAARVNDRKYLCRAIRKYGWDSFTVIVKPLPEAQWDAVERAWISLLSSNNPRLGYNATSGGEHGKVYNISTRRKMSQKCRDSFSRPERIQRHLETHPKGKPSVLSIEQRRANSERMIKSGSPWNKGLVRTPEHRAKISLARKGRKLSVEQRECCSKRMLAAGIQPSLEAAKKGGRIAGANNAHQRWHIKRGLVPADVTPSDCPLCLSYRKLHRPEFKVAA